MHEGTQFPCGGAQLRGETEGGDFLCFATHTIVLLRNEQKEEAKE